MDAVLPREILLEVIVYLNKDDLGKCEGLYNLNTPDYLFLVRERFPSYLRPNLYRYEVKTIYHILLKWIKYIDVSDYNNYYNKLTNLVGDYYQYYYPIIRYMILENFTNMYDNGYDNNNWYHRISLLGDTIIKTDDLEMFIKINCGIHLTILLANKPVRVLKYSLSHEIFNGFEKMISDYYQHRVSDLEVSKLLFEHLQIPVSSIIDWIKNYNPEGPKDVREFLIDQLPPLGDQGNTEKVLALFQSLLKISIWENTLDSFEYLFGRYRKVLSITQLKELRQQLYKLKKKVKHQYTKQFIKLNDIISNTNKIINKK